MKHVYILLLTFLEDRKNIVFVVFYKEVSHLMQKNVVKNLKQQMFIV